MAVTTLKNLEAAERRATAASSDTRRHPLRLRWGRPGSVPLDVDGVLGGDDLPPALLLGHHVDRPPLRLPLQWLPVVGHGALADVHDGHVGPYERDMHDLVGGGRVLHRAWQNLLRERVDFIPSGQPPAACRMGGGKLPRAVRRLRSWPVRKYGFPRRRAWHRPRGGTLHGKRPAVERYCVPHTNVLRRSVRVSVASWPAISVNPATAMRRRVDESV